MQSVSVLNRPQIDLCATPQPQRIFDAICRLAGAGKSSVVSLVMRFYDPNSGQVRRAVQEVVGCPSSANRVKDSF